MNYDPFMAGLFRALGNYARECGVDDYALLSGGYKYDEDDESYKHVRRKNAFVVRVERLLADFMQAQNMQQPSAILSEVVPVVEDFSKQVAQERVQRIASEIRWDLLKRWWESDVIDDNHLFAQHGALKEICYIDPAEYRRLMETYGLTPADVDPPEGYFEVPLYGDDYDAYAQEYGLTQFTTEEKKKIIHKWELRVTASKQKRQAYENRDEALNESWLTRLKNLVK